MANLRNVTPLDGKPGAPLAGSRTESSRRSCEIRTLLMLRRFTTPLAVVFICIMSGSTHAHAGSNLVLRPVGRGKFGVSRQD